MSARVICLSRTLGAYGVEIGKTVADRLGFRYVDEEIVIKAAQKENLDPNEVAAVEVRKPFLQRLLEAMDRTAVLESIAASPENPGVITYSPVGGGLLSGKYGPSKRPEAGRLMTNKEYTARYGEDWVFETAGRFAALAAAHGHHPVSLAVAWAAAHPDITCPIIGARSAAQLSASLKAVEIDMTPSLWREIAALSRIPPPATDRLEEQSSDQGA